MFRVVEEFLTDIRGVDDQELLSDIFQGAIEGLGYGRFGACSVDAYSAPAEDGVALERFPHEWLVYNADFQQWKRDPLPRICMRETWPFLWQNPRITRLFSEDEQAYMREANEAGVSGGLIVPVRSSFATMGVVSMFGDFGCVEPRDVAKLHNLAVHFYDCARRLAARRTSKVEPPICLLGNRERECILGLSAGKSDWDISALLAISERNVERHIAMAMFKLGVPTRTQAVVQAIVTGEISP